MTDQPLEPLQTSEKEPSDTVSLGSSSDLENRLAEAESKRDEYLDLAQRNQAELENYRKRALREQERLVAHAHERLVKELLPILDDLERALEAAERHEEAALVDGVQLVAEVAAQGARERGTRGDRDRRRVRPARPRGAAHAARRGCGAGLGRGSGARGYRIGDKVVRPAKVIVAE